MAADVVRNYKIRYSTEDKASAGINNLSATMVSGSARIDKYIVDVKKISEQLAWLGNSADVAATWLKEFNSNLSALPKNASANVQGVASAFGRVEFNAGTATKSVEGLNAALGGVGTQAAGISATQAATQKLQRSMYGAWQNAKEADVALGKVASQAGGIEAVATATKGVDVSVRTMGDGAKEAGTSFGGLMAAMMAISAADVVVRSIGDSIREAREDTEGWAEDALKLRDELRELANLQGKPGADNEVVAKHLGLRIEAGMDSKEARQFDEQFRGSLPLAKDAGGINDQVADKLAVQVARLAVRTGLEGKTAGDLAGSLGMFGKIPDAEVGLGRSQQIVDLLNDGRGNLTPLVKELMKDAAATVGPGGMFKSLQERAAAVSVSTGMGAIGRSSTRINQAIAGLSGFAKSQGDQLSLHGIKDTDDFQTRIRKIAPLVRFAQQNGIDPLGHLQDMGFRNQVEAKAIVGFVNNQDALDRKMAQVKEAKGDPNFSKAREAARRSDRLNSQFLETDKAARNRVADARLDAAKIQRGVPTENLMVERKEAEMRLQLRKEIDTPETNFEDSLIGGFGLREKLGGTSGRQARIDNEVRAEAMRKLEEKLGRRPNADEQLSIYSNDPSVAANVIAARKADLNRIQNPREAARLPGNQAPAKPEKAAPKPKAEKPQQGLLGNREAIQILTQIKDAVVKQARDNWAPSMPGNAARPFVEADRP